MNTHLVMGEYEAALAASTDSVGFMDAMVLDGLGRREEALERLRRPQNLAPLLQQWIEALQAYLKRLPQAFELLMQVERQAVDPEGFYYRARLFARMGYGEQCLTSLGEAMRRGFGCAPALAADPVFHAVRGAARFREILAKAKACGERGKAAQDGFQF